MSLSSWQAHLKAYREQVELENFQKNRVLPRPKTTKAMVAVYLGLLIALVAACIGAVLVLSSFEIWIRCLVLGAVLILLTETYGRLLAIKVVECYQHYAPEDTRRRCKCVPSCSEYAILCLKKYELIRALRKIRKRLLVTCQGFDYIIDNP